jgi:hypothetical protein
MPQAIRAEYGHVAGSESPSQAVNEGEGIGDEAAADVDMGHDLGDGIDSGPDEGVLMVTADLGDEFVELEKGAAQSPKE